MRGREESRRWISRASRGRRLVPGSESEVGGRGWLFIGLVGGAVPLGGREAAGAGAGAEVGAVEREALVGPLGDAIAVEGRESV